MTTRIINFVKTIRNNWKKSVFGAAAISYGISYGIDTYETEQLMREYCEQAVKYGDVPLSPQSKPRHITVVLNPVSKKRKSKKLFEDYCAPIFHLAGIAVTILQTESENHARDLVKDMNTHTDAIVVAGGDGTLSDVVTGLMRKYQSNTSLVKQCPIGVLPLGQTNRIANSLFSKSEKLEEVRQLADAAMAIVRQTTKSMDIVEVVPLDDDPETAIQSVFAVGAIEWGAWSDARFRTDKYWYFGPLRKYATYIFNGFKENLNWDCNGILQYTDPCSGCSTCYEKHYSAPVENYLNKRWWHVFVPRTNTFSDNKKDFSKIKNENCGEIKEIPISTTELHLSTNNVKSNFVTPMPSIKIELGPDITNYSKFVTEGWKRAKGEKSEAHKTLEAKEIELVLEPLIKDKERSFYIDNEEFELKPLKIKLLPRSITMFSAINDK